MATIAKKALSKTKKKPKISRGQQIAKGVGAILTAAGKSFRTKNKAKRRTFGATITAAEGEGEVSGPAKSVGNIVSAIGKAVTKRKVKKKKAKSKRRTFHN